MASGNEGLIYWDGSANSTANYLGQELQLTAEVSNAVIIHTDPIGTIRLRANGSVLTGLAIPTNGWEAIPDTSPPMQARADAQTPVGPIRVRLTGPSVYENILVSSALTPADDDVLQRKAGAWINRTPSQIKADLGLTKADVGLGNVDNTSDVDKPVSTAQAAADALAVPKSIVDIKGDLIAATAADTLARLPIGTAGQYLRPAAAEASGLRWARMEEWQPADNGYLTWSYDPIVVSTSNAAVAGTLYVQRIHLPVAATITNVVLHIATAGVTLTANQNLALLYSAAGARLATSVDQSAAWASTGVKVCVLTAPYAAAAGDYYVAYFANASVSLPAFGRCAMTTGGAPANAGLTAPNLRAAVADTGLTTAGPANMGAQTASGAPGWVALS